MTAVSDDPSAIALNAVATARALRRLGRVERAIEKYDEAIEARPEIIEVLDECLDLLAARDDTAGIAERCARWLDRFPDHATHGDADRIHSRRIDALCALGGLDLAFDTYGLLPVARTDERVAAEEIVALVGMRDEANRLAPFLDHHRRLGVDRFLFVDNDSSDGSLEFLAEQPDVIVWRTASSYRAANCGAVWWDLLVRRHVRGNWSLVLDADEFFLFPGSETRRLHELCEHLDAAGSTCYRAILLDVYPEGRLADAPVGPDQDPLEVFRWFDRNWYRMRRPFAGSRHNMSNHWGGVRARIFGDASMGSYLLDKVPLFRPHDGDVFMSGMHWLARPTDEIADGRGVLLHTKYDAEFVGLVTREAARGEHAGGARAHRHIVDRLGDGDLRFFDPDHSVRFDDTDQLVRLGIMQLDAGDGIRPTTVDRVAVPPIPPVAGHGDRPLWSVVVLAASVGTAERVAEVLRALEDRPASEVIVVATADVGPIDDSILAATTVDRARIESTSMYLTEIEAANLGIARATGEWVHVIGRDWSVSPDAYDRAAERIDRSGVDVIVGDGSEPSRSVFDLDSTLEPAQVILRRDALTATGGLSPTIPAAATWELVQRLAAGDGSRTSAADRLAGTTRTIRDETLHYGEDVSHRHAAIDGVARRLGLDADHPDVRTMHDRCVLDAIAVVEADLSAGRFGSALATLTALHSMRPSPRVRDLLHRSIERTLR